MYGSGACLPSTHKTKKEKDGNGIKERRGREGKGGEKRGRWGREEKGGE